MEDMEIQSKEWALAKCFILLRALFQSVVFLKGTKIIFHLQRKSNDCMEMACTGPHARGSLWCLNEDPCDSHIHGWSHP